MDQNEIDKLAKIAGHIGGTVEVQSAKAISLVDGMLKSAGLTWADVLVAGVKACEQAASKSQPSMAAAFGFGDIFTDMMRDFPKPPQAAAAPAPKARTQYRSGREIPSCVMGEVRIGDERTFRDRTMLVVTIIDHHVNHGPLAVFDEQAVALIKSLGKGDRITGHVRQPTQERHSPTLGQITRI